MWQSLFLETVQMKNLKKLERHPQMKYTAEDTPHPDIYSNEFSKDLS